MEIDDSSLPTLYASSFQLFRLCFPMTILLNKICTKTHAKLFLVGSDIVKYKPPFVFVTHLSKVQLSRHAMYWQHPSLPLHCLLHTRNVGQSKRSLRLQALELENQVVTPLWESPHRSSRRGCRHSSTYFMHRTCKRFFFRQKYHCLKPCHSFARGRQWGPLRVYYLLCQLLRASEISCWFYLWQNHIY